MVLMIIMVTKRDYFTSYQDFKPTQKALHNWTTYIVWIMAMQRVIKNNSNLLLAVNLNCVDSIQEHCNITIVLVHLWTGDQLIRKTYFSTICDHGRKVLYMICYDKHLFFIWGHVFLYFQIFPLFALFSKQREKQRSNFWKSHLL